jgi:predicted dienelactone hydrolase
LGLAGARFDRNQYCDYCTQLGKQAQGCVFWISKVVAIDPSGTYAIHKESAVAMKLPILLVNLGDKDRWKTADVGPSGSNLLGSLPSARYAVVAPASHFSFLAECKPAAKRLLEQERDDAVCDDPAGADRARVHAEIVELIAKFLR